MREVRSGMAVGLGTGSTAVFATRRIGALLSRVRCTTWWRSRRPTRPAARRRRSGSRCWRTSWPRDLDVTIDGADEVDPALNLIKGGGGAHLREKVVAQAARRELIVVDDTKLSPRLGTRRPVPLEVLELGWSSQARFVESLGATPTVRVGADGQRFRTDQGNLILDADVRADRRPGRARRRARRTSRDRRARPVPRVDERGGRRRRRRCPLAHASRKRRYRWRTSRTR